MLTESQAVAAVTATLGGTRYDRLVATWRSDHLWSVAAMDEGGLPLAGGGWLVGEDAKVWSLSSNRGIHDWDLAVRLLDQLYSQGLSECVEPESFAERLREVTQQRAEMEADVIRDARAGALRRNRRVLP